MKELTKKFGTPLYVYDLHTMRKRITNLKEKIGVYPKTKFMYAIKANFNPVLVREIISHDIGIDAVSIDEVKLGLHCGVKPENLMYTENNITDNEVDEALKLGVLLNIGSLSRLKRFGEKHPGARVCVRFNPNVGAASHATNITGGPKTKFGISYKRVTEVLEIAAKYNLKIVGIHEHIGSGWLETDSPLAAMDVMLEIAKQIPNLEFIDLGGGFGVPYKPDQKPLDLEYLGKMFNEKMSAFCKEYGKEVNLKFEPGRYLVAEAGHLLTEVNTIKTNPEGRMFAGTDTGMHQLIRPAMYGSYHPIRNLSNQNGELKTYDIVGNICESADFFAKDREMPEIREGDILSIDIAGAYGFCMAANYQFRPLPAEILIDSSKPKFEPKIIRKRQTFDQLIKMYEV